MSEKLYSDNVMLFLKGQLIPDSIYTLGYICKLSVLKLTEFIIIIRYWL